MNGRVNNQRQKAEPEISGLNVLISGTLFYTGNNSYDFFLQVLTYNDNQYDKLDEIIFIKSG